MARIHENISAASVGLKGRLRAQNEVLERRVDLLSGKDRLLMTMYLRNGNSFRQMARLSGASEASIARRIHKILKRLSNGKYIICLRNRDKFTVQEMVIAKDYFLMGKSIKQIAAKRKDSYYRIRKIVKKVEWIAELLGQAKER